MTMPSNWQMRSIAEVDNELRQSVSLSEASSKIPSAMQRTRFAVEGPAVQLKLGRSQSMRPWRSKVASVSSKSKIGSKLASNHSA